MHAEEPSTATLLGMRTRTYMFQPVALIKLETDFQYRWVWGVHYIFLSVSHLVMFRRPSGPQWWMKIRSILAILSQHDSTYQVEGLDPESHTDGETLD